MRGKVGTEMCQKNFKEKSSNLLRNKQNYDIVQLETYNKRKEQ